MIGVIAVPFKFHHFEQGVIGSEWPAPLVVGTRQQNKLRIRCLKLDKPKTCDLAETILFHKKVFQKFQMIYSLRSEM